VLCVVWCGGAGGAGGGGGGGGAPLLGRLP
jgi:hypothetical protein